MTAWRSVPGSPRVLVHQASGRSARSVRALTGTSDWRRDIVDRAGMAALSVVGARRLPQSPALEWPDGGLDALTDGLRNEVPYLRVLAAVAPRQQGRARLSMLGRMTGALVVVKLGGGDDRLEREAAALDLLARSPLPGIATPVPLEAGTFTVGTSEVSYLATTAIALGRQRPAIDEPLRTFESDLAVRLHSLPGTGDTPVHGDLTPWNLRRTSRGLTLFDWESAGWGSAGSDIATYRAGCDEVRRPWRSAAPDDSPIGAVR